MMGSALRSISIYFTGIRPVWRLCTATLVCVVCVLPGKLNAAGISRVVYQVKSGENLTLIARKYGVSPEDIAQWNKLIYPDRIYVGQSLKIYLRDQDPRKIVNQNDATRIYLSQPVANWTVITGYRPYGDNRNYGWLCETHGTKEIRSAQNGKIANIGYIRGYGKYILIDHGNGWHSMYSHIDGANVEIGQDVSRNEVIGTVQENKIFFLLSYKGKPVNPAGYFN